MVSANTSTITAKQVQQIVNNVVINNINKCVASTTGVQNVTIIASGNSVVENTMATQNVQASMSCITTVENQTQLANDLAAELSAASKANSSWLSGIGINGAYVNTQTAQSIVNSCLTTNISTCATQNSLTQNLVIDASDYAKVLNTTMTQNGDYFVQCMFNTSSMDDLSNKIASQMNASASASGEKTGKGSLSIVGIVVAVIAGAILIGAIGRQVVKANKSSNSRYKDQIQMLNQQNMMQQQMQQQNPSPKQSASLSRFTYPSPNLTTPVM